MSFSLLKEKIDAIGADIGFRHVVAEKAGELLRGEITKRNDGRYTRDFFTYWTEAVDEDFVAVAGALEAMFTESTSERAQGLANYQNRKVVHRISAVWMEGAKYRMRLARCWSYEPFPGADLKWAAEVTALGRMVIGAPSYMGAAERKKFERDCASEYLAERAMKDLFENAFRVSLDP